jgi:uncharacterized protein
VEFSLDHATGRYQIRSYAPKKITINDTVYSDSLIISPDQLIVPWPVSSLAELNHSSLATINALKPEVVLLGTGRVLQFPAAELLAYFTQQHIGVEVMDTAAACRTFNVLTAEGRRVVAGLVNDE